MQLLNETRVVGPQAQPSYADMLQELKDDIFYTFNCIQVGTIKAYNPLDNTASVKINFMRSLPDGTEDEYPLLTDCPCIILGGGGARLEFPIASGDSCVLLFNDRNLDDWFTSGDVAVPATKRAHHISDAICLVGISNMSSASPTAMQSVRLNGKSKKISIKNDAANLKILIDSLIDAILGLTVLVAGVPGTLNPASAAALQAIKTQFALLLDEGIL